MPDNQQAPPEAQNLTTTLTQQALGPQYAQLVAQTALSNPIGSVTRIADGYRSALLEQAIVQDPKRVEDMKRHLAAQLSTQSGGPKWKGIEERIADVMITTTAQGASTLEIMIIDPLTVLLDVADEKGNTFIQSDTQGYLWPPIDVNFPIGTDCWWRLCQVDATNAASITEANVKLTFEDRIVAWLRLVNSRMGGVAQSTTGMGLAGFIGSLVRGANRYLKGHPDFSGQDWQPIRYVPLVDQTDPNFTGPTTFPASANPLGSLARQNPNKDKRGLSASQNDALRGILSRYPQQLTKEPEFATIESRLLGGVVGAIDNALTPIVPPPKLPFG